MSYRALLAQRCNIERNAEQWIDGTAIYDWVVVKKNVPCNIDLMFSSRGPDPRWVQESGRPADRAGTAFFLSDVGVKAGDRIVMTKGGTVGTFLVTDQVDTVQRHGTTHHIEVGIEEVAQAIT